MQTYWSIRQGFWYLRQVSPLRTQSISLGRNHCNSCLVVLCVTLATLSCAAAAETSVQLGPRPYFLTNLLPSGELKQQLLACQDQLPRRTTFSVAHRGAALQFPEHTRESYVAAARMGAGIIECDVTFTKDRQLVCRHAQCDLHRSTNILATELAEKCSSPPKWKNKKPFTDVKCCSSDLTLTEFRSLKGKMDGENRDATTLAEFFAATPPYRTDLYASSGTLMSHRDSIELFKSLGVKMIPELKTPKVKMPFEDDYTQQQFAAALIDEYHSAGVKPDDVYLQSFELEDIAYWQEYAPEFNAQLVYLDGRYRSASFDVTNSRSWNPSMPELVAAGVKILASPIWMLLELNSRKQIVPSSYAIAAAKAGLQLLPWTLEHSGPLSKGGGWYYQTITDALKSDGDIYTVLDVLAKEVKIRGVFTDWPATTTFYANCNNLQ